jgi:hypothetical protein
MVSVLSSETRAGGTVERDDDVELRCVEQVGGLGL